MDFKHWIKSLKLQYLFFKNRNAINPRLAKNLAKLEAFEDNPVLFAGYIKSGNTWLRFLIYNYFNVLINNASETLSYHQLNKWQHLSLLDPIEPQLPPDGFPFLARTHHPYHKLFGRFQKGIFIYRNPLDTLVSAYHFTKKQADAFGSKNFTIDEFVKEKLPEWELHTNNYLKQKHLLHVKYEDLQANTLTKLQQIIEYLAEPFQQEIGEKSIRLSSFQSIKEMGRKKNQQYGNGGPQFTGEFTRKGKVGSFIEELHPDTIRFATHTMKKFGYVSLIP